MSRMLWLFVVMTLGVFGIDGAVSVGMKGDKQIYVSQEVTIAVDLKTDAFSITEAKIDLQSTQDFIISAPQSAAFTQTIDMNGSDWQMVRYEYKLYPLHSGKISIDPFKVNFKASMGYGQPVKDFTLNADMIELNVSVPQGVAKESFLLVTPHYTLQTRFNPKPESLKVGDAFELNITQEARSVPDILLRPIRFAKNEHLKIYTQEPTLTTKESGADMAASRIDSFTFVAKKEGNLTLPSQELLWWNPTTQTLHTEKIPEIHLTILPAPIEQSSTSPSIEEDGKSRVWLWTLFMLVMLILLYKAFPAVSRWINTHKLAYQESEEGRFKKLLESTKSDDPRELYQAFYHWLDMTDPKLSREGFKGIGKFYPPISDPLLELEEVLANPKELFESKKLVNELEKLRKVLLSKKQTKQNSLPKTINPDYDTNV